MKAPIALAAALVAAVLVLVSSGPASATAPGENGRIAFQRVSFRPDSSTLRIALFTVKPNGTGLRQVTDPPAGVETGRVDWSPDGRWLAYMRTSLDPWRPHILVARPDGAYRTDLSRGHCRPRSCLGEEDPAWSPDGDRIAFIRLVRDTHSLFVMRSDGSHRRRVVRPPPLRYTDAGPAWSPGGERLVFRRWDSVREAAALFTVRPGGGKVRRFTPWRLDMFNRPEWSADGRWILFEKPNPKGRLQLSLIHPDGTGFRRITHSRTFDWSWGSFSPDGTMITAVRELGEASQNDLYVMNLDGSGVKPVTGSLSRGPAEGVPDWGPRR